MKIISSHEKETSFSNQFTFTVFPLRIRYLWQQSLPIRFTADKKRENILVVIQRRCQQFICAIVNRSIIDLIWRRDAANEHYKSEKKTSSDRDLPCPILAMTLINMCLIERNQVEEINKNNKCICSFIYQRQFDIFIEWIHHFHYQRNEKKKILDSLLPCNAPEQGKILLMSLIKSSSNTSEYISRICQSWFQTDDHLHDFEKSLSKWQTIIFESIDNKI